MKIKKMELEEPRRDWFQEVFFLDVNLPCFRVFYGHIVPVWIHGAGVSLDWRKL